jgi:hypothetical protein
MILISYVSMPALSYEGEQMAYDQHLAQHLAYEGEQIREQLAVKRSKVAEQQVAKAEGIICSS